MSRNGQQLPWSALIGSGIFLGSLAGILYSRVARPDYKQLVDSVKANGILLYPSLNNTIVHTFRNKLYSQPGYSEDDPWSATLSTKAAKILLMEVHGRRSREQALKALNRELEKTWEERIEQVRFRGCHERGEEFEERNGRELGAAEEGLCYGEWQ
jgi:hypothetical protein